MVAQENIRIENKISVKAFFIVSYDYFFEELKIINTIVVLNYFLKAVKKVFYYLILK
jgi:hypothetical protein